MLDDIFNGLTTIQMGCSALLRKLHSKARHDPDLLELVKVLSTAVSNFRPDAPERWKTLYFLSVLETISRASEVVRDATKHEAVRAFTGIVRDFVRDASKKLVTDYKSKSWALNLEDA